MRELLLLAGVAVLLVGVKAVFLGPLELRDVVTVVLVIGGVGLGRWLGRSLGASAAGEDRPRKDQPERLL